MKATFYDIQFNDSKDFIGAIAIFNADPYLVETEEQAEELSGFVNSADAVTAITSDDTSFEEACEKLGLSKENNVAKVYAAGVHNQSGCFFCLAADWAFSD